MNMFRWMDLPTRLPLCNRNISEGLFFDIATQSSGGLAPEDMALLCHRTGEREGRNREGTHYNVPSSGAAHGFGIQLP